MTTPTTQDLERAAVIARTFYEPMVDEAGLSAAIAQALADERERHPGQQLIDRLEGLYDDSGNIFKLELYDNDHPKLQEMIRWLWKMREQDEEAWDKLVEMEKEAERARCAKIAEEFQAAPTDSEQFDINSVSEDIAAAIRAGGAGG